MCLPTEKEQEMGSGHDPCSFPFQCCPSSSKAPPPRSSMTSQTAPPTGDYLFRHLSLWRTFIIQTTASFILSTSFLKRLTFPLFLSLPLIVLKSILRMPPVRSVSGHSYTCTLLCHCCGMWSLSFPTPVGLFPVLV